jgi:hypothetical protein
MPSASRRDKDFVDVEPIHAVAEICAVRSVSVSKHISWSIIVGERFAKLLACPGGRWMGSHVHAHEASAVVGQDDDDKQYAKRRGRNREEIDRGELHGVRLKKGAPRRRGSGGAVCVGLLKDSELVSQGKNFSLEFNRVRRLDERAAITAIETGRM